MWIYLAFINAGMQYIKIFNLTISKSNLQLSHSVNRRVQQKNMETEYYVCVV